MSGKNYIKVWCEYDFIGNFGGNNNEEIFTVSFDLEVNEIESLVRERLASACGLPEAELEDLFRWEYILIAEL